MRDGLSGHHGRRVVTLADTQVFQAFRGGKPGSPIFQKFNRESRTYSVANIYHAHIRDLAECTAQGSQSDHAFSFNRLCGHLGFCLVTISDPRIFSLASIVREHVSSKSKKVLCDGP